MTSQQRFAMREFFAPLSLAAVALLAVNDHVLKARWHNALTGKLSDIAGCFFLPLFSSAVLGLVVSWRVSVRIAVGGVATAVEFTVLELSRTADSMFGQVVALVGAPWGIHGVAMTRDLTDLLALGLVPLGCWYGRRRGLRDTPPAGHPVARPPVLRKGPWQGPLDPPRDGACGPSPHAPTRLLSKERER